MSQEFFRIALPLALIGIAAIGWFALRCIKMGNGRRKKKQLVLQILQNARDSGVHFDIKSRQNGIEQRVRGLCETVEDTKFCLDMGPGQSLLTWEGRSVTGYFSETRQAYAAFYSFRAKVLKVFSREEGRVLELGIPRKLRSIQRRRFLRLKPRESTILDKKMWFIPPEAVYSSNENTTMPDADVDASLLHLMNISAGGIGLELPPRKVAEMDLVVARARLEAMRQVSIMQEAAIQTAQTALTEQTTQTDQAPLPDQTMQTEQTVLSDQTMQTEQAVLSDQTALVEQTAFEPPPLLFRIVFRGLGTENPLTLWFTGKIVSRREYTGEVFFGICFFSWAPGVQDPQTCLSWVQIHPEVGVGPLEKWIMRRHHEMYYKLG